MSQRTKQLSPTNMYWNSLIGQQSVNKPNPTQMAFVHNHTKYMPLNKSKAQNSLQKYQHDKSDKNTSSIIQCPNPTANPIINHQKQYKMQQEQNRQIQEVEHIKGMEQKIKEQTELIQKLMDQNTVQSLQLAQQQNFIVVLQNQNSALLTACNSFQTQMASKALPTTSSNNKMEHHYQEWTVSDVIGWITKIANGQFLKYGYCFCLNGVDGKSLSNVTLYDLDKMGVKNDNDKLLLMAYISKLKQCTTTSITSTTTSSVIEGQADCDTKAPFNHQINVK